MNLFRRKSPVSRNITVIVRGVGERTEKLCVELLAAQIDRRNIHLIHETPFSRALKRSYKIGLAERRKWTLVVDADVLVRPGIIEEIYNRAERTRASVFAVQTEMLDKFFGGERVGGIKLYRTALLKKALEIVPDVAHRPEGQTIKQMHKQGFYVDITDLVCGLHDFEQNYEDIYRKGFAHGIKHKTLEKVLLPYWTRLSKLDHDFSVLLAGFNLAARHNEDLRLDKDEVKTQFTKYAKSTNLKEKSSLDPADLHLDDIDKLLKVFVVPPEYKQVIAEINKKGRPTVPREAR